VFDLDTWDFLQESAFSFSELRFSFDFCSVTPDCSCSKMLVQMLKQSSQRVKPYLIHLWIRNLVVVEEESLRAEWQTLRVFFLI
jgi:hypothetical protein